MTVLELILLSAATALAIGLYLWRCLRARRLPAATQWQGHGIDVRTVRPRILAVRCDHERQLRNARGSISRRKIRLASARRVVGRLDFFRNYRADEAHDSKMPSEADAI